MPVLHACMYMHHARACSALSLEEDVGSLETGVPDGCELPSCRFWGLNLGLLEEWQYFWLLRHHSRPCTGAEIAQAGLETCHFIFRWRRPWPSYVLPVLPPQCWDYRCYIWLTWSWRSNPKPHTLWERSTDYLHEGPQSHACPSWAGKAKAWVTMDPLSCCQRPWTLLQWCSVPRSLLVPPGASPS